MITNEMTIRDMVEHSRKDIQNLYSNCTTFKYELAKCQANSVLNKNQFDIYFTMKYQSNTGTNYEVFLSSNEVTHKPCVTILAILKHNDAHIYYRLPSGNGDDDFFVCAYTTHFFQRFKERSKERFVRYRMNARMAFLGMYADNMLNVYTSDNAEFGVYMCKVGFCLVRINKNHIPIFRTFVSRDMLIGEQRTIFDKALPLLERYINAKNRGLRNEIDKVYVAIGLLTRLCKPIYETFNRDDYK